MDILQERLYVMTKDENKDVHLAMMAKVGVPDESGFICYNGSVHALFFRDKESTIVLDYLPEQCQEMLQKSSAIKIVETLSDFQTVVRQYDVPVQQSSNPYPKNILDTLQTQDENRN